MTNTKLAAWSAMHCIRIPGSVECHALYTDNCLWLLHPPNKYYLNHVCSSDCGWLFLSGPTEHPLTLAEDENIKFSKDCVL
jgi:hypothetical protein